MVSVGSTSINEADGCVGSTGNTGEGSKIGGEGSTGKVSEGARLNCPESGMIGSGDKGGSGSGGEVEVLTCSSIGGASARG